MSKKSSIVRQFKLLSLDSLKDRFEEVVRHISTLKKRGEKVPRDLLDKLEELSAAIRFKQGKYKRFHGKREER